MDMGLHTQTIQTLVWAIDAEVEAIEKELNRQGVRYPVTVQNSPYEIQWGRTGQLVSDLHGVRIVKNTAGKDEVRAWRDAPIKWKLDTYRSLPMLLAAIYAEIESYVAELTKVPNVIKSLRSMRSTDLPMERGS